MMYHVLGGPSGSYVRVFEDRDEAENAAAELRSMGYGNVQIDESSVEPDAEAEDA